MTDQQDENKLIAERRAKLNELRQQPGATFPNDFRPQNSAEDLQSSYGENSKEQLEQLDLKVSVAGRVIRNRGAFVVLQDSSDTIQLYVTKEARTFAKSLDLGDIVAVEGPLHKSGKGDLYVQMDDYQIAEWLKNQALNKGVILKENHEVLTFSNNGSLKTNSSSSENYDFIINAAGPWTKELLNKNNINSKFDMSLVRGSHLIVNLKIQCPLVLQSEKDGRIIFMLPLKNLCLIGTTECKHLIKDPIVCTQIERDYLLNIINSYVDVHLTSKDIVDEYAGVRPLVFNSNTKDISKISRDSAIELNQSLINIFGGKWTSGLSLGHKVSNMIETNSD